MERPINRRVSRQNSFAGSISEKKITESKISAQRVKSEISDSNLSDSYHREGPEKKASLEKSQSVKRPLSSPVLPKAQRAKLSSSSETTVELFSEDKGRANPSTRVGSSEHSVGEIDDKEFAEMATALQKILMGPERENREQFKKDAEAQIIAALNSPESSAKIEVIAEEVRDRLKRGFVPIPKKK